MSEEKERPTGLALLMEPFDKGEIHKLPKPTIPNEEWKKLKKERCKECGGWHPIKSVVHLDYVGHAALTRRLLEADPNWSWEPMALAANGTPLFDNNGGMWIKLTVCGVTRLGYGFADGKAGGNAIKETIGDAMRNAAMRFGAALDLWSKADLHAEDDDEDKGRTETKNGPKPENSASTRSPNFRNDAPQAPPKALEFVSNYVLKLVQCQSADAITDLAAQYEVQLGNLKKYPAAFKMYKDAEQSRIAEIGGDDIEKMLDDKINF